MSSNVKIQEHGKKARQKSDHSSQNNDGQVVKSSNNTSNKNSIGKYVEISKWFLVFAILIIAILINYIYRMDINLPVRVLIVVGSVAVAMAIALLTTIKGKAVVVFAREAHIEMRKVIWPTRQETLQTTFLVIAITAIISVVLWGLDSLQVYLIAWIMRI